MATRLSGGRLAQLAAGRAGQTCSVLTLCAFVFPLFAFPSRAHAGDLPRVVVLPYASLFDQLPRSTAQKTTELVVNELKNSEMVQLVAYKEGAASAPTPAPAPVADSGKNPTPHKDPKIIDEADQHRLKGGELIKKLKFKQAVDELERAVAGYEAQHPYVDFEDLITSYLDLAVAHVRLNEEDEAQMVLAQVVRLDPDRKLDPDKYPPVFQRMFDSTAKKAKKPARATVQIGSASGATVIFDGKELGKSPLAVKDVLRGAHFVKLLMPGGDLWADKIEVAAGETMRAGPEGGPAVAGGGDDIVSLLARNVIDDKVLAKALAAAAASEADYVVLGGVYRDGENLAVASHMLRVQGKKFCNLQRVTFDEAMISASIEIYKVGADVTNKVEVFGQAEPLPAKVARDALGSPSSASGAAVAMTEVSVTNGVREPVSRGPVGAENRVINRGKPVTDGGESDKPKVITLTPTPNPEQSGDGSTAEVRKITATPDGTGNTGSGMVTPVDEDMNDKKGVPTWIWIAAGVAAVAAGGAAGGIVYYNNVSTPVTGTASVTW